MNHGSLKLTCLRIAFQDATIENLEFKDQIDRRLAMAQRIYVKAIESRIEDW